MVLEAAFCVSSALAVQQISSLVQLILYLGLKVLFSGLSYHFDLQHKFNNCSLFGNFFSFLGAKSLCYYSVPEILEFNLFKVPYYDVKVICNVKQVS